MTVSSGANTGAVMPTIGPIDTLIARRAPSGQSGIDSPATNLRINLPTLQQQLLRRRMQRLEWNLEIARYELPC